MTILDEIVQYKRQEVYLKKQTVPLDELQKSDFFHRATYSLVAAIANKRGKSVIAEFKRKSPSKGVINFQANVKHTTVGYEQAGAVGISVLTDEKYFGGSPDDLREVRSRLSVPVLRKDFIVDAYQVYEAKAIGADVILLIAACLSTKELFELSGLATSLGLEVLFEVHDAAEVEKLPPHAQLVGVNNRNLKNFEVNLGHSTQICNLLPDTCLKIAESGIQTAEDAKNLAKAGFDAFLIGEYFMKHAAPENACKIFIDALQ